MEKILPVVVIKDIAETEKIMESLKKSGINCAEITFRTACAEEALKLAVRKFPDMKIGAGTVINEAQAKAAINVGAKFIVSPGFRKKLLSFAKRNACRITPGA